MTVPGWERAACAEVPHCAHRTDEGERPTRTQARHSLGEQSVTAAPTQPVESCPTGRPRAPTRLPARNRQVGHTHSFPANAQLGPETDFTEKQITPLWPSGLQTHRDGMRRQGMVESATHKRAPGPWRQAMMWQGPHPSGSFPSSPLSYKNSFSQSLRFRG